MKEIILCKYGEIVLKGANRGYFEDMLCKTLRRRAAAYGNFTVRRSQSTIVIEPQDDFADLDGMFTAASRVFGIVALDRAVVCEKNMDAIRETARQYVPQFLEGKRTFKVEGKRSDKRFPLDSIQIAREVGGAILSAYPHIKVDVHNPDVTVRVEIRETSAFVHAGQCPGAGGLPVGSAGNGMLLLSGGIDSPVAGWMMAKRGVRLEALYFESIPYTSEQARQKVLDLAALVARWSGSIMVHVISLTHIQEELVRHCDEEYFTLLLRRYMMQLANMVAKKQDCQALITGESLGQVASQTMHALNVTNALAEYPVFRPVIGMDKEEIVQLARHIGTFETSILPFEDCCTVFTPKHPKTRPDIEKVILQEQKYDYVALENEAFDSLYTVEADAYAEV